MNRLWLVALRGGFCLPAEERNATITSRSDDLWSSSGRSDGAATGAKSNAATVRTKTHSVIVIAQMITGSCHPSGAGASEVLSRLTVP